jgi:hypothetical protein
MTTWWVSFATKKGFLGVAIVDINDDEDMDERTIGQTIIEETIIRGCNPGDGSVQMFKIPDSTPIPDNFKNRLLGKNEITELEGRLSPQ